MGKGSEGAGLAPAFTQVYWRSAQHDKTSDGCRHGPGKEWTEAEILVRLGIYYSNFAVLQAVDTDTHEYRPDYCSS